VAKKQLASVLQVLLGNRRLRVAEGLPEARTLKDELGKFTVKITEALNEHYEASAPATQPARLVCEETCFSSRPPSASCSAGPPFPPGRRPPPQGGWPAMGRPGYSTPRHRTRPRKSPAPSAEERTGPIKVRLLAGERQSTPRRQPWS
jgi:hypothetical protein